MRFDDKEIQELKVRYVEAKNTCLYLHKILLKVAPDCVDIYIPDISHKSNINGAFITGLVESHFNCNIKAKTRRLPIMRGRHAACYLLSKYTKLGLSSIANLCGQGDHTTAIHSRKRCEEWMETDSMYKDEINFLEKQIELAIKSSI